MRVMIIGQRWLAVEVLALCLRRGDVITAVSSPTFEDRLSVAATHSGIPVVVSHGSIRSEHIPPDVDVLLCAHAHAFITAEARAKTRYGALGYHPSLLPRHRGRDAIRWAVHMREDITGGTVYWMDNRADGGPVAAQDWCFIRPDDTPDALWRRELAPMGIKLFEQVLADLDDGKVVSVEQEERLATWEPSWSRPSLASRVLAD